MTEIISTPEFDKEYKRLKKKYRSLPDDFHIYDKGEGKSIPDTKIKQIIKNFGF